ncbi:MAG: methyltransferase, partial [Succinivibrio sp.]|nr:methyltransferase [Succinivibrio sp.]
WDHFYSDVSFKAALKVLSELGISKLNDVGGNTGKFAIRCCETLPDIKVSIFDLKEQIALAKENIARHQLTERIDFVPCNLLSYDPLPKSDADLWWMSQFLDCFSEEQICSILEKIKQAMRPEAKIAILEPFWDRQHFEAASYSLNAGSLYFTAVANGNSRFYGYENFCTLLQKSGFKVDKTYDKLGVSHTLLICSAL